MKKLNKKVILLLALALVILTSTVSGTVAWLTSTPDDVVNSFTAGKVEVDVDDDVSGKVKSDVVIKNTGTTDAYIRAAIVGNWVKDGKIVAAWDASQGTFTSLPGTDWKKSGDYYYYTKKVRAGGAVKNLFHSYEAPDAPVEGAHLEMDIIAQAIQAEPVDAVVAAWGVDPSKLS